MYLFIYLFIHLFIYLFIYLFEKFIKNKFRAVTKLNQKIGLVQKI